MNIWKKLIEQNELNDLSLQLAILDIDNFKRINDTYGHWVGDIILIRVASIIKETVTPNDFVARYGGEEFAVIFTEKTLDEAYRLVEQIRHKLYVTLHPELDSKAATISIGLQEYMKGKGKEALFKGADASLYAAKRTGKKQNLRTLHPVPRLKHDRPVGGENPQLELREAVATAVRSAQFLRLYSAARTRKPVSCSFFFCILYGPGFRDASKREHDGMQKGSVPPQENRTFCMPSF